MHPSILSSMRLMAFLAFLPQGSMADTANSPCGNDGFKSGTYTMEHGGFIRNLGDSLLNSGALKIPAGYTIDVMWN